MCIVSNTKACVLYTGWTILEGLAKKELRKHEEIIKYSQVVRYIVELDSVLNLKMQFGILMAGVLS